MLPFEPGSGIEDLAFTATLTIISIFILIISAIYTLIVLIATWRIFTKAGQPGWAAIIPIYNLYILTKITFGNGWLFLLLLLPIVNIFFGFIQLHKLSLSFGKGIGYTLGLIFLNPIFMIILGFDNSRYLGVAKRI